MGGGGGGVDVSAGLCLPLLFFFFFFLLPLLDGGIIVVGADVVGGVGGNCGTGTGGDNAALGSSAFITNGLMIVQGIYKYLD